MGSLRSCACLQHGPAGAPTPAGQKSMGIFMNVISPHARGSVTLTSSNPFAHPAIDPNILGTPFDKYVLSYALRAAQRFTGAKAFKGYVVDPLGAYGNATTDAELEAYASANAGT
jgi:choline dehydrogenase-like flavoprotein